MPDATLIRPKFHHVNLKTTRLKEMIDFYSTLVGADVLHEYDLGAWMSNDAANHRIALLAFPNFVEDPELPETARRGHHAGVLPRSRHDVLVLLQRPRRELRRAPGRQLR
jgi:catechol-2,3-dioxygenase